jgi:DNA replication and repair protein RecF
VTVDRSPPRTVLRRLALTDFRSYERAELALDGGPVWLFGSNGAGKTNLLEAVSFLAPGRGLRTAAVAEVGRRLPGEARGRAWSVSVRLDAGDGELRLGTGVENPAASRRVVRVEGEPAPPGRLAELLRLVWLTPQQDRLFLEGASERRRFFDRLTYAAEPAHASWAAAYDKAQRERMRLLTDGPADPAWLNALETRLGESGAFMALARARTLAALQAEIDSRTDRPFPLADLDLSGEYERAARDGEEIDGLADRLRAALERGRVRDAAAGRMLAGPHRTDLVVRHRAKDRDAAECSTGEQKALILNLVLAQAARLSRDPAAPNPIVLLDEVAAHLDADRRAALFDEIMALRLQAFLTGTDEALFTGLKGRAQGVRVDAGELTPAGG